MPAGVCQEIEYLPGVHRAARQKVAAPAPAGSSASLRAFGRRPMTPDNGVSARARALTPALLLPDRTHELFGRDHERRRASIGGQWGEIERERARRHSLVGEDARPAE